MDSKYFPFLEKSTHSLKPVRISGSDPNSVALCFKVPFNFRQRFKFHALQRGVTMTELLFQAVESYIDENHTELT
jgi:hypothetical protein